MKDTILAQIMGLKSLSTEELLKKYEELFDGKKASSDNRIYLVKRIAYRLQELEYGGSTRPEGPAHHYSGLSAKAKDRLKELIEKYDPVNNKAIRPKVSIETQARTKTRGRDIRLPIPGTIITKDYRGKKQQVKVLEDGFEYEGKIYKHLTAVAEKITGAHWNGYNFFNL